MIKYFLKKINTKKIFNTISCLYLLFIPFLVHAQDFEEDSMYEEEDIYGNFGEEFENSEFGVPNDFLEPGLLEEEGEYDPFADPEEEDNNYLDDNAFGVDTEQAIKESLLDQGVLMQKEKKEGISNILYGAGTGLMIGAWTAFITSENTTRTQWRTIGTSTVLGGFIGAMLGTRSIWDPNAARPISKIEFNPNFNFTKKTVRLKFTYNF